MSVYISLVAAPPVIGALPKRYLLILPTLVVAVAASVVTPLTDRALVAAIGLVAMGLACWGDRRRLAWCWGFLLPIDVVAGVPIELFDVARFGGLVWLCLAYRPTVDATRFAIVTRLAVVAGAVAIIRGIGSVARLDRFGIFIAFVMLVGAITAPWIAARVRAHVPILAGFLAGVLLTATVSIMQALDLPTLREGNQSGSRYPGLASTTMLTTWHLAFGLIIACYFVSQRRHPTLYRVTALAVLPVAAVSLVVNGAQGGLLGLLAAGFFVGIRAWRQLSFRTVAPFVLGGLCLLGATAVGIAVFDVETPTIDGIFGEGDYKNELSRLEVNRDGIRELAAHPLVGVGRTNFEDEYDLAPHFLPLEAGITSGLLGFVVAGYLLVYLLVLVLKGPATNRPSAWLGLALAGAMWSNTLIETGGPFTGLPRFSLLLIAVLAARGEAWDEDDDLDGEADGHEVPARLAERLSALRLRRPVA